MSFPGSILLNQGEHIHTTSDKRFPLGTRGYTRDGRSFRYSKAGATALTIGLLMQAEAPFTNADICILTTDALVSTGSSKVKIYPSSTSMFSSANAWKDGYLWVSDSTGSTGQGQLVQIYTNTKSTSTGTAVTINMYQDNRLSSTLSTKAQLCVSKNPYDDIIVNPVANTAAIVGVTPCGVTANYYFWLATWGPCPVKCGAAALDMTSRVRPSTAAAGTVLSHSSAALTNADRMNVGYPLQAGASAEWALVYLMLAP